MDDQPLIKNDERSRRLLGQAFVLITVFMLVEVAGGLYSGSLALISDAAHMLFDSLALGFNWLAIGLSLRPADSTHTYGHYRIQVISAFLNGLLLMGLTAWIIWEAITRLVNPQSVMGGPMLAVAVVGLLINLIVLRMLSGGKKNLSHKAAWAHVLGDTLGSVAAVAGGLVILLWQYYPIDPILSLCISGIIIKTAWGILKSSWDVLMESQYGLPCPQEISRSVLELPRVEEVHHIHLWKLTPERPVITLHVRVEHDEDAPIALRNVQKLLKEKFNLTHSTIQVESAATFHEEAEEVSF